MHASASIAVLPFLDLSAARDQDYLCEGIAEELITALTHLEGLRVTNRGRLGAARPQGRRARVPGAMHRTILGTTRLGRARPDLDLLRDAPRFLAMLARVS